MSKPAKRQKLDESAETGSTERENSSRKETAKAMTCEDVILKYKERRKAVCASVAELDFNEGRVRFISSQKKISSKCQGIVYWMWRDQRVEDNWALLYAQALAMKHETPLHVCFCLPPKFLEMTMRQYDFIIRGLRQVEQDLIELDIGFHLLLGEPDNVLPEFVTSTGFGGVVTDFCPLRIPLEWLATVSEKLPADVLLCQVDAHNIVPCWQASPKLEYAARTIRPKIQRQLPDFLTEFPPVIKHPYPPSTKAPKFVDWEAAKEFPDVDRGLKEVKWAEPGTTAGLMMLESFCKERLKHFGPQRNDPTVDALSNLSPWFHAGQLSVQRAVLRVQEHGKHKDSVAVFVEESVIRRELADNFCFYNSTYDSLDGAPDWAQKTLRDHAQDKREYTYSLEQLEHSTTHDDLWNAAQCQLVQKGKMHGFLRMYWAKKILEWTSTPEEALTHALFLNDRYSLDGTDPNGYVGCMWSIGGVHDRGWADRAVLGKIRYMNYKGCQRKFDVASFVRKYGAKNNTTQNQSIHGYLKNK